MSIRRRIVLVLFFLQLSIFFSYGWYEKTHAYITKVAVELLQRVDEANTLRKYEEIYRLPFKLELGRGGWREDFNPPVAGNERAFRHFYDPDKSGAERGAKFYYHFYVWIPAEGAAVTKPASGYYENLLDWAYNGASLPGNPFHWVNAIEAYDHTVSSRKEAYYRLGHICHLLADMSEPDHATGTPHPGSGKIIPDTLESMFGAPVLGRIDKMNIPPLDREVMKAALGLLYLKFKNTYYENTRIIGLEGLIEDNISFSWVEEFFWDAEKTQVHADKGPLSKPPIDGRLIKKFQKFNEYFNTLGRKCKAAQKASGLPLAIGCADIGPQVAGISGQLTGIPIYEPIYAIPTIDVNDSRDSGRYFNLAWPLIQEAGEYSAGLLEHFFDIVNPPPYVREVVIAQDGETRYHALWRDETKAVETGRTQEKIYEAEYTQFPRFYDTVPGRGLTIEKRDPVESGKPAVLTIHFGPEGEDLTERMDPASVSVFAAGEEIQGQLVDAATWEARFTPGLPADISTKEYPLEIRGRDAHNHYPRPGLPESGYDLDSDPATAAKSESSDGYPWLQGTYEPGPDTDHSFYVTGAVEPEEEQEELPSGGACPVPPGARLIDQGTSKSYRIGIDPVGPSISWYDEARTMLKAKRCYDKDGRRMGDVTEYHKNGGIKMRGQYEGGVRHGVFSYYFDNGNPEKTYTYDRGETTGPYSRYHKNGNIAVRGEFLKGKEHKDWSYYNAEGKLTRITPKVNGVTHGMARSYYTGDETSYTRGGGLSFETEFRDNSRTGPYKQYHKNGQLYEEGQFTDSCQDGFWKTYYENGKVRNEITYQMNRKVGRAKFYDEDGELASIQVFDQDGEMVQVLDKDGKVTWEKKRDGGCS